MNAEQLDNKIDIQFSLYRPNKRLKTFIQNDVSELTPSSGFFYNNDIESDAGGLFVSCNQLIINSGGTFLVTKIDLTANLVRIDQSGILEANYKATVIIVTYNKS